MCIVHWLNENSGSISALATIAIAVLTYALVRVGQAQVKAANASAEVAQALRNIEIQRDHEISVSFVQVPNKNAGGAFEFKTASYTQGSGIVVKSIRVRPDGSVKVELNDGKWQGYAQFIIWRE